MQLILKQYVKVREKKSYLEYPESMVPDSVSDTSSSSRWSSDLQIEIEMSIDHEYGITAFPVGRISGEQSSGFGIRRIQQFQVVIQSTNICINKSGYGGIISEYPVGRISRDYGYGFGIQHI